MSASFCNENVGSDWDIQETGDSVLGAQPCPGHLLDLQRRNGVRQATGACSGTGSALCRANVMEASVYLELGDCVSGSGAGT